MRSSVAFSAWLLGHDPAKQIICASYGQDLADKHARDCRTLMASAFYRGLFPRTSLLPEKLSVNGFMTTAQGFSDVHIRRWRADRTRRGCDHP